MTTRDKIMDKYWGDFLLSDYFSDTTRRYENATPLEATFWEWFKDIHLTKQSAKPLQEYL